MLRGKKTDGKKPAKFRNNRSDAFRANVDFVQNEKRKMEARVRKDNKKKKSRKDERKKKL